MRILAVADLHYSLQQLDWLGRRAPEFDVLAIAGDLLDLSGHLDLDAQTVVVEKYLGRLGATLPVVVCSGNHDLDLELENGERVADWLENVHAGGVVADRKSLEIDGFLISVCPWWDGPGTQATVASFLDAESAKRRDRWVWIYHAPPDRTKVSWTGREHAGDAFLIELIAKHRPDAVLSGHIHNSPFRQGGSWIDRVENTWVFNPGRQLGGNPAHIIIDLNAMKATWESDMDTVTVDLNAVA